MIEYISVFGVTISLYYLFWLIGAVLTLAFGCVLGKHYGFSYTRSLVYIAGAIILGYGLMLGTSWVIGGGTLRGQNFIRIIILMPIPVFFLTRLMRDPFWKLSDLVAPLMAIYHGITHIGCIFPGCCHGYSSTWGLYSNNAGAICFPIQIIEVLSSLLVSVILLIMIKRNKNEGMLYAWYLILFGGTRFIWEFFRDNEKIWYGLSELSLHALAAVLLGLVVLIIRKSRRAKHFDNNCADIL